MRLEISANQFAKAGPTIDGIPLLAKVGNVFYLPSNSSNLSEARLHAILQKIACSLNRNNFVDAAILFAQNVAAFGPIALLVKANFDPAQPRDSTGRWAETNETKTPIAERSDTKVGVTAAYCKIIKELCIVEATATLPTRDDGFTYFKALNSCMDRHGCLGVV